MICNSYVYESTSYWDKDKQQPRSKRKLIGKVDPVTGETVPTGGRGKRPKTEQPPSLPGKPPVPEPPVTDSPSPGRIPGESDYRALYEECLSRLHASETALAEARDTIAAMEGERLSACVQLQQLIEKLQH